MKFSFSSPPDNHFLLLTLFSLLPSAEVQMNFIHTGSLACEPSAGTQSGEPVPFDLLFLHSGSSPVWGWWDLINLHPLRLHFAPTAQLLREILHD